MEGALYIYKYREFSINNLNALQDNKIWFSRGSNFNDPFDCSMNVPVTLTSRESIKNFIINNPTKSSLVEMAKNDHSLLENIVDSQFNAAKIQLEKYGIENHELSPVFNIVSGALLRLFVCCFSKNATNPLLWSHYAGSHSGYCIRFKKEILLKDLLPSQHGDVKYSNSPVNLMNGLYDGSNAAKDIIFSKSLPWKYEDEYRLIHSELAVNDSDNYRVCDYSDDAIDCIILGYSAGEKNLKLLKSIFNDKKVFFKKIERGTHDYNLHVGTGRL